MNGAYEAKGLLIIIKKQTEKKNINYFVISLKKGFFKSFSGQNRVNSSL